MSSEVTVIVDHGGDIDTASTKCWPEDVSDNTSATWSDTTIPGRSSPISAYAATGYRSVSFSLTLHREVDDKPGMDHFIQVLRMGLYPKYVSNGVVPPVTTFIAGEFKVKGILRNLNISWKKPIIDDKYHMCDISVSIDELPPSVYGKSDLGMAQNPFNVKKPTAKSTSAKSTTTTKKKSTTKKATSFESALMKGVTNIVGSARGGIVFGATKLGSNLGKSGKR